MSKTVIATALVTFMSLISPTTGRSDDQPQSPELFVAEELASALSRFQFHEDRPLNKKIWSSKILNTKFSKPKSEFVEYAASLEIQQLGEKTEIRDVFEFIAFTRRKDLFYPHDYFLKINEYLVKIDSRHMNYASDSVSRGFERLWVRIELTPPIHKKMLTAKTITVTMVDDNDRIHFDLTKENVALFRKAASAKASAEKLAGLGVKIYETIDESYLRAARERVKKRKKAIREKRRADERKSISDKLTVNIELIEESKFSHEITIENGSGWDVTDVVVVLRVGKNEHESTIKSLPDGKSLSRKIRIEDGIDVSVWISDFKYDPWEF